MQKVTLGGERLGSGKKMQVELHGYERSTHDLGYLWRSTMSAGTLVPFMSEIALPGDTFDIDLDCDIKTHPTIGPLFGSYKIQLDVFQAPIRLYNSYLHNNRLGIGTEMSTIKLPQIELNSYEFAAAELPDNFDLDNSQINPSCLLAYLGIRGIGMHADAEPKTRKFNAIPILAYWEIYKNYYSNKQEKKGAVIHYSRESVNETVDSIYVDGNEISPESSGSDPYSVDTGSILVLNYTGTKPQPETIYLYLQTKGWISIKDLGNEIGSTATSYTYVLNLYGQPDTVLYWNYSNAIQNATIAPQVHLFELDHIDFMRDAILSLAGNVQFLINNYDLEPYNFLHGSDETIPNILSTQEGLGLKTYQSDLFNNWLDSEDITAITTQSAISTVGDSFTIDQLNLAKKVYDYLNRVAVSGGTYDDWLDATYAHDRIQRAESPIYHGGLIRELVFQEVVSNSESEGQPLGTLAGKGIMGQKKKGGKLIIKVDEPSYLIGIISLTPRIDYSQGNKWDIHLKTMDDLHKPALDQIGFQDLITEQMAWWDTYWDGTKWVQKSAGKQPAWLNYMTNTNRTLGNFAIANNEMFMTLNRRYEYDVIGDIPELIDLTTYIDPVKFNFIFAETSLDAQNFWAQIAVDITARRKMSAKIMPNL